MISRIDHFFSTTLQYVIKGSIKNSIDRDIITTDYDLYAVPRVSGVIFVEWKLFSNTRLVTSD